MFIHRQTLSKRIRVVVLSYIPLPLSLGIGNIKTAAPTSTGKTSRYCWYRMLSFRKANRMRLICSAINRLPFGWICSAKLMLYFGYSKSAATFFNKVLSR